MMTCQQVQKLLPDYSVERLGTQRQEMVARHLGTCVACAQEWETLQGSLTLLEHLDRAEPPAGMWAQVEARLTTDRPRPFWRRWLPEGRDWRWQRAPVWVGAMAVVLIAAAIFLRPGPEVPRVPSTQPAPQAFGGNSYMQQYAMLASYEPLADRAALGAVATLARREEH